MGLPATARSILAYAIVTGLLAAYGAFLLLRERPGSASALDDGRVLIRAVGYRDEIAFAARIRPESYTELELRSSRESPMYAPPEAIQSYLDRLEGLSAGEIAGVEGISGATVTSDAIRSALARAVESPRGISPEVGLCLALWLLALLIPRLARRPELGRLGMALLSAAAFFLLGVLWNSPPSLASLASGRAILAAAPFLALATAALLRNVHCSCLCPFGTADRLLSAVARRLPPRIRPRPGVAAGARAALRPGRYVLLAIGIASLILGHELYVEPYAYLFSRRPIWWLYLLPALALLLSLVFPHLWCRCFCPFGALLDLTGRLRGWVAGRLSWRAPAAEPWEAEEAGDAPATLPLLIPLAVAGLVFGIILLSNALLYLTPAA